LIITILISFCIFMQILNLRLESIYSAWFLYKYIRIIKTLIHQFINILEPSTFIAIFNCLKYALFTDWLFNHCLRGETNKSRIFLKQINWWNWAKSTILNTFYVFYFLTNKSFTINNCSRLENYFAIKNFLHLCQFL